MMKDEITIKFNCTNHEACQVSIGDTKVYPEHGVKLGDDKLTASEALFGFIGWLAIRDENVVLCRDSVDRVTELVNQFICDNKLHAPRDGWYLNLVKPNK